MNDNPYKAPGEAPRSLSEVLRSRLFAFKVAFAVASALLPLLALPLAIDAGSADDPMELGESVAIVAAWLLLGLACARTAARLRANKTAAA